MSDELNEAFRRLARGERFAPAAPVNEPEPKRRSHGSADGGARGAIQTTPTNEELNQAFRDLARGNRGL